MASLRQAVEGEGQVVLLSGEARLGKSRLTQALCERLGDEPHQRLLYQCSPYHTHSAFYPLITRPTGSKPGSRRWPVMITTSTLR